MAEQGGDRASIAPRKVVLVCGCPRSGTTMLANALGATPGSIVTPESQFVPQLFAAHDAAGLLDEAAVIDFLNANWRFRLWGQAPRRGPSAQMDFVGQVRDVLGSVIRDYAQARGRGAPDIWIDHTPTHIQHLSVFTRLFDEVHLVYVLRDGRAVMASVLKLDWGPTSAFDAAGWWIDRVASGLAAFSRSEDVTSKTLVRYEDLVSDPEIQLRRLCRTLGIDYDDGMLSSRAFELPTYTQSQHRLVGHGFDKTRLDRWRTSISRKQIAVFEAKARALLEACGYDVVTDCRPPGKLDTLLELMVLHPIRRRRKRAANRKRIAEHADPTGPRDDGRRS